MSGTRFAPRTPCCSWLDGISSGRAGAGSKSPRYLSVALLPKSFWKWFAIMKRGSCSCGAAIFFGNSQCLTCGNPVGQCTQCHRLGSFSVHDDETHVCDQCHTKVTPCIHRANGLCNSFNAPDEPLCALCQFTRTVPDCSEPNDTQYWGELERAKRRLLIQLQQLKGLPPYVSVDDHVPPLVFDFKKDLVTNGQVVERVYTGHAQGVITINLREADSVYREKTRIELGEPQRTLIGHFRHEYGHYLDLCIVDQQLRRRYHELFGDPDAVSYEDAKQAHYQQGPAANWSERYVSAYASMHPWEDFAESVNVYLDLTALAETANDQHRASIDYSTSVQVKQFVPKVLKMAVAASEFNLDMGLPVLLPEIMPEPVLAKLEYIHHLRSAFGNSPHTKSSQGRSSLLGRIRSEKNQRVAERS